MALRAADLAASLTVPPALPLDSKQFLPFSAAVGPLAVQKDPTTPLDDSDAASRHQYYTSMQSVHNMSLSMDKAHTLSVPLSTEQMLGAAPLLPALMSLAPGLVGSQVCFP